MLLRSSIIEEDLVDWQDVEIECGQQMDGQSCGPFIMMVGISVVHVSSLLLNPIVELIKHLAVLP